MKVECPGCHHLFSIVTESKELIEDEKVEDFKDDLTERVEDDLEMLNPFSVRVPGSRGEDVAADDLTYEYRFKCTHCGREWTELREKERTTKG
ncbi:MAG: hypothetical protein JRN59_08415 [Nitrososphaerota archaeon]|nr:hypothetical protein [Nitrososphaerota archaeon]